MKRDWRKKNQSGLTLIETIIYIALFSLMIGFAIFTFYQILETNQAHQDRIDIETEANFIMQKILWALSGVQTINQPALNTTSSVLSVTKYNFSQNPVIFDITLNAVRISRGANSATPLNSDSVRITSLAFYHHPAVANQGEAVSIIFTVAASSTNLTNTSTTLQTKVYLKK